LIGSGACDIVREDSPTCHAHHEKRELSETQAARRALDPPTGAVLVIDQAVVARAIRASRASERGRMIAPFHKSDHDALHRMLNVVQPGSYIRPHRHLAPPKAESLVVLQGKLVVVIFDVDGNIIGVHGLGGDGAVGIDLEPGVIHTFFVEEPDTVVFEVKPGPYLPATDKDFMPWAPEEGSEEAPAYLDGLRQRTGDPG